MLYFPKNGTKRKIQKEKQTGLLPCVGVTATVQIPKLGAILERHITWSGLDSLTKQTT